MRRCRPHIIVSTTALLAVALGTAHPTLAGSLPPPATILQRTENPTPVSSAAFWYSPDTAPAVVNGAFYFPAFRAEYGFELWKTSGVQGGASTGASLVIDLVPGPASGIASAPVVMNNMLYFVARSSTAGAELWKSDGTAAGTTLVKDIRPGMDDSSIDQLYVSGTTIFFVADDGISGAELWSSNGTAAGTRLVSDIAAGPGGSGISRITVGPNNTVVFAADDGTHGNEPWIGTATESVRVNMFGTPTTNPTDFTFNGNTLYFAANTPSQGRELVRFKADAITIIDTVAGASGGEPEDIAAYGTGVVFSATTAAAGRELWKSDGTAGGTAMVKDINPGAADSDPSDFISLEPLGLSRVMFSAYDPANGNELWVSNLAGFDQPFAINPGTGSSDPSQFTIAGGKVFFTAEDGTHGIEAWQFTPGNAPVMIKDLYPGNNDRITAVFGFVSFGNGVLFLGDDSTTGREPWFTNGTANTMTQIQNIAPDEGLSSLQPMGVVNGRGIFYRTVRGSFFDGGGLIELWASDGTPGGTGLVRNFEVTSELVVAGALSGISFIPLNGFIYFAAYGDDGGNELWRTNGTFAGTARVADINPGSQGSSPRLGTLYNGALYFSAYDDTAGRELWRTNGTTTQRVADIYPGFASASPEWLTVVGDTLFFSASTAQGDELWRLNGSGLAQVKDIYPGSTASNPSGLVNRNGTLFFAAQDSASGEELWKSDGTAAGTTQVRDINPGSASSQPYDLIVVNGALFFSADDGSHGSELWKSDGTVAGTMLVTDLAPGLGSSGIAMPHVVNNRLVFAVLEGDDQGVLWTSDGSASGTRAIPGPRLQFSFFGFSRLYDVSASVAVFSGWDAATGQELWMTDGTPANTRRLTDIAPNARPAFPDGPQVIGDRLVFGARDATGHAFWSLPAALLNERLLYLPLQVR